MVVSREAVVAYSYFPTYLPTFLFICLFIKSHAFLLFASTTTATTTKMLKQLLALLYRYYNYCTKILQQPLPLHTLRGRHHLIITITYLITYLYAHRIILQLQRVRKLNHPITPATPAIYLILPSLLYNA